MGSALGESAVEDYPPLAVLAGWAAALTGHTADAQRWALILDAASFDQVPVDGTASFESARAMLRVIMCAAGPEQAMTDARLAVRQEPPWSVWRDQAQCLYAEAHLLTGNIDQAAAMFAESAALAATLGNTDVFVLSQSEIAVLAMDRGRWAEAAERVELALAAVDEHRLDDYATCVLAFATAARLSLHSGDMKEVDRQLTRAMRARPSCTFALPFLAVRMRLQLAKVRRAKGDHTTTRQLLREIDDVMSHRPDLGALINQVSDFRAIVTSSAHVGATGGSTLTPAELRLLPFLQTYLTIREIGERLLISRSPRARRSPRSIESWASRYAVTRCNVRRPSVCSAGSRGHEARRMRRLGFPLGRSGCPPSSRFQRALARESACLHQVRIDGPKVSICGA